MKGYFLRVYKSVLAFLLRPVLSDIVRDLSEERWVRQTQCSLLDDQVEAICRKNGLRRGYTGSVMDRDGSLV